MTSDKTTNRVILIDVMDTLVHDPIVDGTVAEFFGQSFQSLVNATDLSVWYQFELGEVDEVEALRRGLVGGDEVDIAALRAWLRDHFRWIDGMEELLRELHARGVEIHVLSNYSQWYELVEEAIHCSRYLEWSFVSCRTGVRKPDPAAFLGAAAQLGVDVSACLLVDDRKETCDAARGLGMDSIRFRSAADLRRELRERGLLE